MSEEPVAVVPFTSAHTADFARLNFAWIEKHFAIEEHDREQLLDPETHILRDGGQILIAVVPDGTVVGTCALVATGPGEFELAKMSVADSHQGQGIGRLIGKAAIAWAEEAGATRLWLESNRKLPPALRLYESLGFQEVPLVPSPYARCDIRMEMNLPPRAAGATNRL